MVSKTGGCALDLSESADSDVLLSAVIGCYASYVSCILLWHNEYEPPLEGTMDTGKLFVSHSSYVDNEAVKQNCADSLVLAKLRVADSKLHMTNVGYICVASSCNTHFFRMAYTEQSTRLGHHCGLCITFVYLAETYRVLYCPDQSSCQELLLDMCVGHPWESVL